MKKSGWSNKTKAMRIVGTKQLKDGGGVGIIESDIKEGVSFKNKSGTTFVIDKIELDPKFGKLVSSSLLGGKKGNYRDEITDFIAFLNKEKVVKYETGGGVEEKWQIKDSNDKYFSVSMQTGNPVWNESPDLGYSYEKQEAEKIKDKLVELGTKDLKIVEYNPNWWKMKTGGRIDDISDKIQEGDIVWDERNKRYGVVLNTYDYQYGEIRLDSDGNQPIEYLHKLGSEGDKGTKVKLQNALIGYKSLRLKWPEYKYEKVNYADGGGIDINELNMPVIRSQFEEEEFEFGQGGGIYSRTMKTPDGNIIGKVQYNDFWKTYQVVIDGVVYEEFKNKEEAIENLKNAGFDKMALGGGVGKSALIKIPLLNMEDSDFQSLQQICESNDIAFYIDESEMYVLTDIEQIKKSNEKDVALDIIGKYDIEKMALGGGVEDQSFDYMMLDRLRSDNEYYLGYGNRSERNLWAGNVNDQIDEMKRIWNKLKVKPEWLSLKDILEYEKKMKNNYANGGRVEAENKEMVLNNNNQIAHHTEEMNMAVKNAKNVPAWVVAKVNRSATDLSDAAHYMEGQGESYADGGGTKSMFNSTKQKMQGKTQQERIDSLIEFVSQSKWSSKPITIKDNMVIVFSKMYDLEPIRVASIFNKYQGESYADGGGVGNNFYALTSDGMKNKRKEKIQSISYWKGRQSTHKPTLENIKEFLSQVPFDEKICIYTDDDNSFYGQLHSAHVPLYTNGAESVDAIVDNNNNIIWNKYKGSKYEVKVENYKMETGGGVEIKEGEDYLYGRVVGKNYTYTNNKIPNFSLQIGIFKEGKSPNNHYAYLSVPNNVDASILSNLLNKSGSINNSNNSYSNQFSRYDLSEDEVKIIINHFKKISGTKKKETGGGVSNEIAEIKAKIEKAKKNTIMPENLKKQYIEKYEKQLAALTLDKGTKKDVKDFLEVPKGKTPKIVKVEPKKSKEDELAEFTEKIMIIESDILDNLEISSGGEIKQNDAVQKKYIAALDKKINANMFKGVDVNGVRDILEDENYHTLNNYLGLKGYYGESGKNDYKSYYDRNITKGNKIFLNPSFFGSATKTIEPKKETKSVEPSKGRTIRAVAQDKKRTAKKAGKRTSKSGNTYYESRENHSDKNQKTRLENGGATKGWKHRKNN